jgi:hypothetical protein
MKRLLVALLGIAVIAGFEVIAPTKSNSAHASTVAVDGNPTLKEIGMAGDVSTIRADGKTIDLFFNETLNFDENNAGFFPTVDSIKVMTLTSPTSVFTGTERTIESIIFPEAGVTTTENLQSQKITLLLAEPISDEDLFVYVNPCTSNALERECVRDLDQDKIATFDPNYTFTDSDNKDFTNGVIASNVSVAPSISTASLDLADNKTVTVTFDEGMTSANSPQGFSMTADGENVGISVGNISGTSLTVTLDSAAPATSNLRLSYTPASTPEVKDDASTPNPLAQVLDFPVTRDESVHPTVTEAKLDSTGVNLTVKFDEPMGAINAPAGFTVNAGDPAVSQSFTPMNIVQGGKEVVLVMDPPIPPGLDVSLDYSPGAIEDLATTPNGLEALTDFAVTREQAQSSEEPTPPPYTGPLISGISEGSGATFNSSGTDTVTFEGERLGTITKAFINGIEAEVLSTSNDEFEVSIPEGLEPGTYDLEITSSAGNLTYLDAITIVGTTSVETTSYGEVTAWTSRISDTQVKVYVKFPTVGEKVRISHQTGGSGSYESVYVKTTSSETMEGLRIVEGVGTYVVRTIDLSDINRIRVTVGDEELVQVRYNN